MRNLIVVQLIASFLAVAPAPRQVSAVEIEGVQPAALDQPRVNVCFRRQARGRPLAAGVGAEQTINVQMFLDTGASGVILSKTSADALGIARLRAGRGGDEVVFHDVGVGGSEPFAVAEPLFVAVASNFGGGGGQDNPGAYDVRFGPVHAQVNIAGGGLLERMLGGGLDVLGMPAMKGRVVVLDPRPVDSFADTMRTTLLDAKTNRKNLPKVDRRVSLSFASFARFTRIEPNGARGPDLADNPFVGPSPVRERIRSARPAAAAVPPVVITFGRKSSSGSWLLDTGAAASMISTAQAKAVGVEYVIDDRNTGSPKLSGVPEEDQFTLDIGGIGGQKTAAGFFLDTLTLPTRERDPIVYKRAPVLVMDITVEDPETKETVTLDGVLGMNFFVASARVKQAGGLPDINNLTVGAYEAIVFDEPLGTLGLKLKKEFLNAR